VPPFYCAVASATANRTTYATRPRPTHPLPSTTTVPGSVMETTTVGVPPSGRAFAIPDEVDEVWQVAKNPRVRRRSARRKVPLPESDPTARNWSSKRSPPRPWLLFSTNAWSRKSGKSCGAGLIQQPVAARTTRRVGECRVQPGKSAGAVQRTVAALVFGEEGPRIADDGRDRPRKSAISPAGLADPLVAPHHHKRRMGSVHSGRPRTSRRSCGMA
jgi:hypothetical protein